LKHFANIAFTLLVNIFFIGEARYATPACRQAGAMCSKQGIFAFSGVRINGLSLDQAISLVSCKAFHYNPKHEGSRETD